MKNKFLIIKLAGILGLIFFVVLFIFLYFFPTVEKINKLKREMKLKQELIQEANINKANFETFTSKEWQYIQNFLSKSLSGFPVINNQVDLVKLSSEISAWVKERAAKDQVKNVILLSNTKDLDVNQNPIFSDPIVLKDLIGFTNNKNKEILLKAKSKLVNQDDIASAEPGVLSTPFGHLSFRTIVLGISSDFLNCLNFLNHLTWGKTYIDIPRIEIEHGKNMPKFMIMLRVLYFDKRKSNEK